MAFEKPWVGVNFRTPVEKSGITLSVFIYFYDLDSQM